ncbi:MULTISPECIES: hypothetical protein [unclassified Pseudonocardia]|jgi:hypothetical protein|uniref:hypothetical protein n=1 Tax=unclassified Pseudonocardia TaxID=2619320 RepID=UPI000958E65A|nr:MULTISPECIES: hypothetical protein [unclassified Pseudonocardia]MBN9101152.1 hypothetical protein [Pseudonocardia sp.]OJY38256.1 MAG: hypothetical protein BGP03_04335 [Pseudonocardia sp. 73-21]
MAVGTTARRGAGLLASVLRIIGLLIVAVLVVFIVLTLLDANFGNTFAAAIKDLAGNFDLGLSNLFLPADPKVGVLLNYGVAAIIWYVITSVVVRIVRRVS